MKRKLLLSLLTILCCSFFADFTYAQSGHTHHHNDDSKTKAKEAKMKAAYIYHILNQYVEWEDKQQDGFLIGIVGENKMVKKNLEKIAKKLAIKGEKIAVEMWSEKKEIDEYQALFIGNVSHEKYDEVLIKSTGEKLMTFTDVLLEEEHDHEDHLSEKPKQEKTSSKLKKVVHRLPELFEKGKKEEKLAQVHEHEVEDHEEHIHDDEVEPQPIIRFIRVNNKLKFSINSEPIASIKLSEGLRKMSYKASLADDSQVN